MLPSFFVRWRKERERVVMVVVLLIFRSSVVEELWFLRCASPESSAFVIRLGCQGGQRMF